MKRTLIIAEAGVNHNGNLDLAFEMVDAAKEAGADIIKFQTAKAETIISKYAPKADYQVKNTGIEESQLDMVKKIMLPYDDFYQLKEYCHKRKIGFLSTPFAIDGIEFLDKLGIDQWKIPSGEITNYPYLVSIAKTGKDIIMSTGMSELSEIASTLKILKDNGAGKVTLLHCNTQYPTPMEDVNLKAMLTLRDTFKTDVGYSDHTLGIEVPIAAVSLGASVIEKHFTLSRKLDGPDHAASLEPKELKDMILAIRNIEVALGNGVKTVSNSEYSNRNIARKSIVAKKEIKCGDKFTDDNITTKRPGNGISPMCWNDVIGLTAKRDFEEDELIEI